MTATGMDLTPLGETKTISTADGRTLAYVEFGDPAAPLVIHNHGGPSCRFEGQLLANGAIANGLRLVSVDRPGIGRSSRQKNRSFKGWCDDLLTIADALGYHEFGVSGLSEGGPWPIAAAFYIDQNRLRHVTSIAGGNFGVFGDNWAAQYQDKADALGGKLAMHSKFAFHLMYEMLALDAVHFGKSYLKTCYNAVNDYDKKFLDDPAIAKAWGAMSAECFAHGSIGLVEDAELLYRKWAFDVTKIERPVHMWQGTGDKLIPYELNRVIADRMPGSVWHPVEDAGHLVAVGEAVNIFAIAAHELSG